MFIAGMKTRVSTTSGGKGARIADDEELTKRSLQCTMMLVAHIATLFFLVMFHRPFQAPRTA